MEETKKEMKKKKSKEKKLKKMKKSAASRTIFNRNYTRQNELLYHLCAANSSFC